MRYLVGDCMFLNRSPDGGNAGLGTVGVMAGRRPVGVDNPFGIGPAFPQLRQSILSLTLGKFAIYVFCFLLYFAEMFEC